MTFFAVGCVLGFLGYRIRRGWVWFAGVILLIALIAITILNIWILIRHEAFYSGHHNWNYFLDHWRIFLSAAPELDSAIFARFIFGSSLGFGFAYVTDTRDWGGVPRTAPIASEARHAYMSVGLAILVLALIAPHLDHWLSQLGGLKTSFVEVQLNNISSP